MIVYIFLLNFVMSFASGADHQASSAIVSKQSLMSKIYTQSHFVHMLQTLPVSSNSEVLIMFPEQFDIDSWIIEVSTFYRRKKLRSLGLLFDLFETRIKVFNLSSLSKVLCL